MKVLGKRANMSLFVYPVVFVLSVTALFYFGNLLHDFFVAVMNDDLETMNQLEKIIDKYTVERGVLLRGLPLSPFWYVIYSSIITGCSLYAFNRRIVQPKVLIEYDDRGFYLNLPFNKTWYVNFEEVLCIDIIKDEDLLKIPKWIFRRLRRTNMIFSLPQNNPDAYISVKNSTFGILKTGTIIVGLADRTIKVRGVKNAFEVAKEMQVICNDGKRRHNEWLDEKKREQELKKLERREQELRAKTKT